MEQSSCVSELLLSYDSVSRYKYGLLNIDYDPFYLKMEDEIYLLTEGEEFDLVTIQPTDDIVVFDLEVLKLKMECGKSYFLKPAPESILTLEKCIIKKYISIENITEDNVKFSAELDFAEQRLISLLRIEIGTKRLKMTCWPFVNVTLDTFLKNCDVPHCIVLKNGNDDRLFDEHVDVESDPDDSYHMTTFFKKKFNNDQNEAFLFEKTGERSYLIKKIKNFYKPIEYNGSSLTSGSTVVKNEYEEAFVIFNPDSSPCEDDVVLPLDSKKYNSTLPYDVRRKYWFAHSDHQTLF